MPDLNNNGQKIPNVRDLIKIEYAKCAKDPAYFMMKYVFIQRDEGRSLFNLFPFQKLLLQMFRDPERKRFSIVKSRQLGITTLCAAYALWTILFNKDKFVVSVAPTQTKATFIVRKVIFAYDNLPSWLKEGSQDYKKKQELSITLKNGSSMEAVSGDSDSARGLTAHLLIIDEAAFIDNADTLWASAQQTLAASKGDAIVLSTPNGVSNWFHKNHEKAVQKYNKNDPNTKPEDFLPIALPWNVHPERDQVWRDQQTQELGERLAAQECDCNFQTSGATVILPTIISWYEERIKNINVKEYRGNLSDQWIFENAKTGRDYVCIADVARGDGSDYSTYQMFDLVTSTQVAEYKGQIDTKEFPRMLIAICTEYNDALLIIERESIGWGVVKDVIEKGYKNLYYSPKGEMVMDEETWLNRNYENDPSKMTPGFSTNVKVRPQIIACFRSAIERIQKYYRNYLLLNSYFY